MMISINKARALGYAAAKERQCRKESERKEKVIKKLDKKIEALSVALIELEESKNSSEKAQTITEEQLTNEIKHLKKELNKANRKLKLITIGAGAVIVIITIIAI